jgi:hypothetical protein
MTNFPNGLEEATGEKIEKEYKESEEFKEEERGGAGLMHATGRNG